MFFSNERLTTPFDENFTCFRQQKILLYLIFLKKILSFIILDNSSHWTQVFSKTTSQVTTLVDDLAAGNHHINFALLTLGCIILVLCIIFITPLLIFNNKCPYQKNELRKRRKIALQLKNMDWKTHTMKRSNESDESDDTDIFDISDST